MINRAKFLTTLLVCFSFSLLNLAYADQKQTDSSRLYGKVTEIINAAGYTYVEVDTDKKKVWAAGPKTSLTIGDMVAFSTGMPMENFHSTAMDRDFPIIYFIGGFITDKDNKATNNASIALPHRQNRQKQEKLVVKDIGKVKGGNTIAEIYTDKQKFNGKTIRVRGQVTKFTPEVMGKNWVHIRDSSTLDDLSITTDSTVAINDIVVLEGKIELDKNYGYGYEYPLIMESARIIAE